MFDCFNCAWQTWDEEELRHCPNCGFDTLARMEVGWLHDCLVDYDAVDQLAWDVDEVGQTDEYNAGLWLKRWGHGTIVDHNNNRVHGTPFEDELPAGHVAVGESDRLLVVTNADRTYTYVMIGQR